MLLPLLTAALLAAEAPFQDLAFDAALAAAQRDSKVVLIDFFTTWCVPCKKLDRTTWADPEVRKWLAEKTVALKIDAEKEVELASRFGVGAYPTIVFIKPDGKKLDQIVGYRKPDEFLSAANDAISGKDSLTRAKEKLAGREKDPMARSQYADDLVAAGKLEEALAEYLWCFDHGNDDPSRGFRGVRLSFLLGDILELGRQYPPAIKALEERRDKAEAALVSGAASRDDARDMVALNKHLGAQARTLSVFDRLRAEKRLDAALKEAMVEEIAELLVEAGRYADLADAAGDLEQRANTGLERCKSRKDPPGADEEMLKLMRQMEPSMRERDVREISVWYETLLGTARPEKASGLAEKLIAYSPTGSTYAILIERALHAKAVDAARALAQRGRSSLPDAEKAALESAAGRIPAAK